MLPHVRTFPHLRCAVDRALHNPEQTVMRLPTLDQRDVDLLHRYTAAERGQILAFTWWVHVNRNRWPRSKLHAAISALSPLMMFSSSFFAEMTGLPQQTASKHMIKSPKMDVKRVTGSCDMRVVHHLLELTRTGMDSYREAVAELAQSKGIPRAMLSRISGIPVSVLARPERGVQFFPELPDLMTGVICTQEQIDSYWLYKEKTRHDPDPGDQQDLRQALAGASISSLHCTAVPLSEEEPFYSAIPGLPSQADRSDTDSYLNQINTWEEQYLLSAPL